VTTDEEMKAALEVVLKYLRERSRFLGSAAAGDVRTVARDVCYEVFDAAGTDDHVGCPYCGS
jgi:hypothetical protein